MNELHVNQDQVPWEEQRSPGGKFQKFRRFLTQELGYPKNMGPQAGGMPFDIELTRVPSGAANFPYHHHAAQWEAYIIVEGNGILRLDDGERVVKKGEVIVCPPGHAHQLRNEGVEDLVYYVIADNPPCDVFYYPDSDKYGMRTDLKFFKMTETDYYEGEEE